MGAGTNDITITTAANFIPENWSKKVRLAVESTLIFANAVLRFDFDVANFGDTIHVPDISNMSATAKAANTPVTLSVTTESMLNISIDKNYYVAFGLEYMVNAQSKYNLSDYLTQKSGYALRKQIDSDIGTLVANFTQNVGSDEGHVVFADLLRANQYLDDADAPDNDRILIVKPSVYADMLSIDRFTDASKTGNGKSPIQSGYLGQIFGSPVHKSTNVYKTGGRVCNALMHKEALALAMQIDPKVYKGFDINYVEDICVTITLYGVAVHRNTFGVEVKGGT